jgi:hypothetical protein
MYWKIIQEDHKCIVTRATTAIALHLLHTVHLAALQSVWVLTTHVTYSSKYRRSGYAPGFTDKQNEHKQKPKQQRKPKTSTTLLLNKGKLNNDHVQVVLDLGFHGFILWGRFGCIVESGEVLNADWAL